ncbi:MAG: hypothetical protein ACYS30_25740, partial [Planctomycetota bacterium]
MNFVEVMVEQGLGAAVKSLKSPIKARSSIKSILGKIPARAGIGFGPHAGQFGEAVGRAKGWLGKLDQRIGAQMDEMAMRLHVYDTSLKDSMRKSIKAASKDIAEQLPSMTDEQHKLLTKIANRKYGNMDEVADTFRAAAKEGGIDVGKNMLFLDEDEVAALKSLDVYEDWKAIALTSESYEEAAERIDEIMEARRQMARDVSRDTVAGLPHSSKPLAAEELADVTAHEMGFVELLGEETAAHETSLLNKKIIVSRKMRDDMDDALEGARRKAHDKILIDGSNEGLAGQDLADRVNSDMDAATYIPKSKRDDLIQDTRQQSDDLRNSIVNDVNATKGVRNKDILKEIWERQGLGELPENLNPKAVRKALWEKYFPKKEELWKNFNIQYGGLAKEEALALALVSDIPIEEMDVLFDGADKSMRSVNMWENAVLDGDRVILPVQRDDLQYAIGERMANNY